jgi:hypothetical protein
VALGCSGAGTTPRRLVSEYLSLLEKFEHENIENDEYLNEKRNSK